MDIYIDIHGIVANLYCAIRDFFHNISKQDGSRAHGAFDRACPMQHIEFVVCGPASGRSLEVTGGKSSMGRNVVAVVFCMA